MTAAESDRQARLHAARTVQRCGSRAIAAMRRGMKSYSIDREPTYMAVLARRVHDERSFSELALVAD